MNIFIASSTEGIKIAETIQEILEQNDELETFIWTQDVFTPSSFYLKSLYDTLILCQFGIFVFSPDDTIKQRDIEYKVSRDNVIFELGLFMGKLGYENCFIIKPKFINNFHLPSDLFGLHVLDYNNNRKDENLISALGPTCAKIRRAISKRSVEQIINQKKTSLTINDSIWLNEIGSLMLKKNLGFSYIIAFDVIGFESLNKKYGESFCNTILEKIDFIIHSNSSFNKVNRRIGDTFIIFCNTNSENEIIKTASKIYNEITNFDWDMLAIGLYINMSTSVCKHIKNEEIFSWVKRTMQYMKLVKSRNISEITIATILPNENITGFDFS